MDSNIKRDEQIEELLRHRWEIFSICLGFTRNRLEAEDLTQEVYLKAVEHLGTVKNGSSLKIWLTQIARNSCRDRHRLRRYRWFSPFTPEEEPRSDQNPETIVAEEAVLLQLKQAIQELSSRLREVFVLKEYGGLSYEEISQTLGIPQGTVMSRLNRARRVLAVTMEVKNVG